MKQIKFFLALVFLTQSVLFSQSGWVQQYSGTNSRLMDTYFINEMSGFASGEKGVLLKTTTGGSFWYNVFNRNEYDVLSIYFISDMGWAVVKDNIEEDSFYVFKTINSGISWNRYSLDSIKFFYTIANIEFVNHATGYITAGGGFFKSTNGGLTWFKPTDLIFGVGSYFIDSMTGWACNTPTKIYKTFNGGYNWIIQNLFTYHQYSADFHFVNSQTGFCLSNRYNGTFYKTTNGGTEWFFNTNRDYYYASFDFVDNNTGYIIGMEQFSNYTDKFLKTTNCGLNWTINELSIKQKFYNLNFTSVNTGWVVGDSGTIMKTTNGGVTIGINQIGTSVPREFSLSQNYPNPFNPVTKIKFDISGTSASQTFLSVYDIMGREVEILVNEMLKPGKYEVDWNAVNYTSGVYYYKITSGDFTETRKMVLVK